MKILNLLFRLFKRREPSSYDICRKTIKRMGYKLDDDGTYYKDCSSGKTVIWIMEKGIKIKVYAYGYAESDFLPYPITNQEALKRFIRENEL